MGRVSRDVILRSQTDAARGFIPDPLNSQLVTFNNGVKIWCIPPKEWGRSLPKIDENGRLFWLGFPASTYHRGISKRQQTLDDDGKNPEQVPTWGNHGKRTWLWCLETRGINNRVFKLKYYLSLFLDTLELPYTLASLFIMTTQTMKAVNYQGPYKVKVQDIELPKLEHPDDVIVKVTTVRFPNLSVGIAMADKCSGCYLWLRLTVRGTIWKQKVILTSHSMYEGRTAAEPGITFGTVPVLT